MKEGPSIKSPSTHQTVSVTLLGRFRKPLPPAIVRIKPTPTTTVNNPYPPSYNDDPIYFSLPVLSTMRKQSKRLRRWSVAKGSDGTLYGAKSEFPLMLLPAILSENLLYYNHLLFDTSREGV